MTKIPGVGKAVAYLRGEKRWSQEALAASAGVSTRTVQRIEEGKAAALETVAAIARVLELEVDALRSMALCLDVSPTMVCLARAYNGRHIVAGIRKAEGSMHMIHTEDRALRDAALALVGAASDWADLVDDAASEGHAERNLDELLSDLHAAGGSLFHGRLPVQSEFRDLQRNFIMLDTVVFVVYPDGHSQINIDGDREFVFVGTPETEDVLRKYA